VLLDRRVDPKQKIELRWTTSPVRKLSGGCLARGITGTTNIARLRHFGPTSTAERLATVARCEKTDTANCLRRSRALDATKP